jgi:hypothetical protein
LGRLAGSGDGMGQQQGQGDKSYQALHKPLPFTYLAARRP